MMPMSNPVRYCRVFSCHNMDGDSGDYYDENTDLENLILTGSDPINGTGNLLSHTHCGQCCFDNELFGFFGNDTRGGAGNDCKGWEALTCFTDRERRSPRSACPTGIGHVDAKTWWTG